MNLYMVLKKWHKLSSQEYDKEITVKYKKSKATLPKIIFPDMMEVCEIIDECPYDTYPGVMEECFNNNLDEICRYIT